MKNAVKVEEVLRTNDSKKPKKEVFMRKKVIALVMALILAGGCLSGGTVRAHAANEERQEKMEDVLLKVKTKIELDDDEYINFSYRYDTYSRQAVWYFDWSNEDNRVYMTGPATLVFSGVLPE